MAPLIERPTLDSTEYVDIKKLCSHGDTNGTHNYYHNNVPNKRADLASAAWLSWLFLCTSSKLVFLGLLLGTLCAGEINL